MKNKIRSATFTFILALVCVALVWIGYVAFLGGPARAYEKEDRYSVEAFMEREGYTHATILNRFSYDQIYYIVDIKDEGNEKIAWFSKKMDKMGEHDRVGFEPVYDIAANYGIPVEGISFGVYQDQLVYVLKNKDFEKFITIDGLQTVFDRGRGL